jgi:hypothetical protein
MIGIRIIPASGGEVVDEGLDAGEQRGLRSA